ncbi:MAG: AAA family ATPase [Ideonella sp.]|nr:AAA family ATPase [Ideonella sp.]MCC7455443.1 AAA family ATPase [Nitrospira sp.]
MSTKPDAATDTTLVRALHAQLVREHGAVVMHETHLSWVLLAGAYAYKIKKPVRLSFVDLSTLAVRRHCCDEELRINRRLAPALYLGVVPITGSAAAPRLGGEGEAIEYAVRMRRFAAGDLASERLACGTLPAQELERFAAQLSAFHESLPAATPASGFGTPERMHRDLELLLSDWPHAADAPTVAALRRWFAVHAVPCAASSAQRVAAGRVRECHGDLHLDNLACVDDALVAFDALEFDAGLRWIDVASELAFVTMDLRARGHAELAHAFAAAYLEAGGDYAGLPLLRGYEVYRALVRARVTRLRAGAPAAGAPAAATYLTLARQLTQSRRPRLLITHGLPGSGKTWLTRALLRTAGAVRVRSDVERARLLGRDRYGGADSDAVYARLLEVARVALHSGYPTIVDAAFLQRAQRAPFAALAASLCVPFTLLHCTAPDDVLRARVRARSARADDASQADEAVLDALRPGVQAPADDERGHTFVVDTSAAPDAHDLARRWAHAR